MPIRTALLFLISFLCCVAASSFANDDCVSVAPTIGYGHVMTPEERELYRDGLTEEQALELLRQDMRKVQRGFRRITADLTQAQRDALTSFFMSIGSDALQGVRLLDVINNTPRMGIKYGSFAQELNEFIYERSPQPCFPEKKEPPLSEEFMNPDNLYGVWKVMGFEDSYMITNKKDEVFVKRMMGKEITFDKMPFLTSSYWVCDKKNTSKECDNATLRALYRGQINKIVHFEACAQEKEKINANGELYCRIFYSISIYVFENGDVKFFIPTDGGYFAIEKVKLNGDP